MPRLIIEWRPPVQSWAVVDLTERVGAIEAPLGYFPTLLEAEAFVIAESCRRQAEEDAA
jgi:hypothetical protein